jgi:hypothetical protein
LFSCFFKQPSVPDKKKHDGRIGGGGRNEIQYLRETLEETRDKQPTSSDCVENKDALLENKNFLKFLVIHKIMNADEVRDETRLFVSGVLCYVLLA